MHEKFSEASAASLCDFKDLPFICISSMNYATLVDDLFPMKLRGIYQVGEVCSFRFNSLYTDALSFPLEISNYASH